MHAEIKTVCDALIRFKIVEERLKFDRNPEKFLDKEYDNLKHIRFTIKKAQYLLPKVKLSYELRLLISQICSELNIEGLRGDIVVNRAAKAYAALNNTTVVGAFDIMNIIVLCLRHRLRKDPLGSTITSQDKILASFADKFANFAEPLFPF